MATTKSIPPKRNSKEPKPRKVRAKKERPARETPAHMAKVNKIANSLPELAGDTMLVFTAASQLSTADLNNLMAHVNVEIRRRGVLAMSAAVENGTATDFKVGDRIRVISGLPRFVGQTGVITKKQRIRLYVRLEGSNKDAYLFIADVAPISAVAEQMRRISNPPPAPVISTIDGEEDDEVTKTGS